MDIRFATLADVPAILALQEQVAAGLAHSDMLSVDDAAFYAGIVAGQGQVTVASVHGQIIGGSVLRYPTASDASNLGRDVYLPLPALAQVAHLESAYLLPAYRGQGLAHDLSRRNMDKAVEQGRPYILATAWPGNVPSLKNLFSLGFQVRGLAHKYGGKLRCILLYTEKGAACASKTEVTSVALADEQGHRLALGQGLQGSGLRQQGSTFSMVYTSISA